MKVVVVSSGPANLSSVSNMLKKVGCDCSIARNASELQLADKIVFPGVGSFDTAISILEETGMKDVLNELVLEKKVPILGICLGMHLFTKSSDEGVKNGLGWVGAKTVKFDKNKLQQNEKIPHMGWNQVCKLGSSTLYENLNEELKFYFLHSYHVLCDDDQLATAISNYGYEFVASFQKEHIFGTQFHPEKSHKYGIQVIKNFVDF